MPFGLDIFKESIQALDRTGADIIIQSKRHPKAEVRTKLSRKVFSSFYNSIVNRLFRLQIADTQGQFLGKTKLVQRVADNIASSDTFFQTEFFVIAKKVEEAKIEEIPVSYLYPRKNSKMKTRDAWQAMLHLVKYYFNGAHQRQEVKKR